MEPGVRKRIVLLLRTVIKLPFVLFLEIYGIEYWPVPVAARSKALVCGRSPAEIVGSNPTGSMDICLL